MSVKTALIEDVLNEKTWDGPNGRVYYYDLVLDNGERGSIGTKTRDSFKVNDSLTYEATHDERGTKFKRANLDGGNFQPRQNNGQAQKQFGGRGSEASFALSYAKDFIAKAMEVHNLSGKEQVTTNQWVEAVLVTAAKFNAFLKENGNG